MRKYTWQGRGRRVLFDAIGLEPGKTVVDVGCGTGAFTRVLAQGLEKRKGGRAIGVDIDPMLLRTAKLLSREQGFDDRTAFRKGDARSLPLPDGYADIVVCQAVLWLITGEDRVKVLKEMIRVCKSGGVVAAVEGSLDTSVVYFPDDEKLTELYRRRTAAWIRGYPALYGYDRNIGYKLPAIFSRLGLTKIRIRGLADVRLQSDPRFPLQHTREVNQKRLEEETSFLTKLAKTPAAGRKKVVEKEYSTLKAGGMSWEDVVDFMRRDASRRKKLRRASAIRGDMSVEAGMHLITTGTKE